MKHLLTLLLFALGILSAGAQEVYYYGFCEKGLSRSDIESVSTGKANTNFYCFIELSAEDATLLAGNQITHLHFSLGYCSASSLKIVITEDPAGEPLYSQYASCTRLTWNDAKLTSPYTIEAGKPIYIGYEVAQKYSFDAPVDVVKNTANGNTKGDIIGIGTSKDNAVWSHATENGHGNLCILAQIEGDRLPRNNAALCSLKACNNPSATEAFPITGDFVTLNSPFAIQGEIKNIGLDTLTRYTVTYRLDGKSGDPIAMTASLAHDSISTFVIPNLEIAEAGRHEIQVTLTEINGGEDDSPADNTLSYSFEAYADIFPRNVLIEMFTSQTCQNCDLGDAAVEKAMEGRDNAIYVAHHSGFAADSYTHETDEIYTWFFSEDEGTFNPAVMFDRTNINAVTLNTDTTPVVFPYTNRVIDYIDYALAQPAFVQLNEEVVTNFQDQSVRINVKAIGESSDQAYLNVWIVEDNLVGAQQTNDGVVKDFTHNGVLRYALTEPWGQTISLPADYSFDFTLDRFKYKNSNNLRAVAFITRYDANDKNRCKVLNATQQPILFEGCGILAPLASDSSAPTFDLFGRRVQTPSHGIFIQNGKTIIK